MGDQPEQPSSMPEPFEMCGKSQPEWMNQVDAEFAFRLVDSILPFEACLYHQILPLSLEGSRLKLGMVNPEDTTALDYVRRILAYMNCSLVPQRLASEVHYAALSAYLNYSDRQKKSGNSTAQPVARRIAKKLAEQSAKRTEVIRESTQDPHAYPTLVVDSPTELPPLPIERSEPKVAPEDLTVGEFLEEAPREQPKVLNIQPQYLDASVEILAKLSPPQLLEELLGRVLSWGIGRLYLEWKTDQGRILWSQNGILQAVLEGLPRSTFTGVIHELKHLTQFPLMPIQKPKQVEIDRIYQGQRLLLRLRLMPGRQGCEEATLQVLRGAALKFYRQQQLVNLGHEALGVAQQLQQKMNDVYAHSRSHGVPLPPHLNILPELDRALKRVNYQLKELQNLKDADTDED
jgi:type II secretory ATPase GspE/PulE/Tfp pilus assembly ATPase PilB-like protein